MLFATSVGLHGESETQVAANQAVRGGVGLDQLLGGKSIDEAILKKGNQFCLVWRPSKTLPAKITNFTK